MASSPTKIVPLLHVFLCLLAMPMTEQLLRGIQENPWFDIFNETVATLDQDYFKDHKNASILMISYSTVERADPNFLCSLPNLRQFILTSNKKFPKITSEFFECTPNLEEVTVSASEIEQDSLSRLRELTWVSIDGQNFGKLRKNFLSGNKLNLLHLTDDHIQDMDEDVFVNVPNLEDLILSSTLLYKPNIFKGLNNLKYLRLYDNILDQFPWNSLGVLPSLRILAIYGSKLNLIDAVKLRKHFPQLRYLYISKFKGDTEFYEKELKNYNLTLIT